MNTKMSRRQKDIKSKLMAAIAMLLVSSIMMVSTTYAWFTLSTAPEVTGISTSVGANGNLEMALMPVSGSFVDISSSVGDSSDPPTIKNTTWGNLVDLSDNDFYGLDKIQLYPSELHIAGDDELGNPTALTAAAPLDTPVYGADGRVKDVVNNTILSRYDNGAFRTQNEGMGVRAAGSASGMTTRQLDYRNALSSATSAMNAAVTLARRSLADNGGALSGIAIKKVTDDENAKFTSAEVAVLQNMVNGVSGAVENIQKAYNQYFLAIASSAVIQAYEAVEGNRPEGVTEDEYIYKTVKALVNDTNKSQGEILETLADTLGTYVPGIADRISDLEAIDAKVATVKSSLDTLVGQAKESYTWDELSGPLTNLVNINVLTINDIPVSEAKDRISEIAMGMSGGLVLAMPTGGGIYADIADYCGDYTVHIQPEGQIEFGGTSIDLSMMQDGATMATKSDITPSYLSTMGTTSAKGAPTGSGNDEDQPLSEMYGYVIDLAFRTNAASSNLLLQTEATGRIYDESQSNEETMGHGSTMTFTGSEGFPAEKVANLMEHIRIVFFDPATGNIYGTAKLNMGDGMYETGDDGLTVTADINMYTIASGEDIITYEPVAEGATDGTHIKDAVTNEFRPITGDEVGTHKEVRTPSTTGVETWLVNDTTGNVQNAVITPLTQNTAQAVSVLVYLNGESITNADVAIGESSATGSMNLQFASSANLVPMSYANLMGTGTVNDEETDEEETTTVTATLADGSAENVSLTDIAYDAENRKLTFKLSGEEGATYTVKNGETELTATEGVYTIEGVEASVAVTVTKN